MVVVREWLSFVTNVCDRVTGTGWHRARNALETRNASDGLGHA